LSSQEFANGQTDGPDVPILYIVSYFAGTDVFMSLQNPITTLTPLL